MHHDPIFLGVASLAVILVGLSKGGLGGMSLLGVPVMAVFVPPVQAAAILLPVMIVMDMAGLAAWRGWFDWRTLRLLLPAAFAGIAVGWATAALVSDDAVRLIVGLVSALFVLMFAFRRRPAAPGSHRPLAAQFWGLLAGYTSFVAHAGAPPYQIYTMPLNMEPRLFTGTATMFFAITNAAKLIPYFALGELDATNLTLSAMLVPLAALSTFAGAWLVKRMPAQIFYPFMYASIGCVAVKLIVDGIAGL